MVQTSNIEESGSIDSNVLKIKQNRKKMKHKD